MRIQRVSIENFRCFEKFVIELNGEPRLIIGENAIGKSSLMAAMARALGKERIFQRNDFLDLEKAIDIRVTLSELSGDQLGVFHDAADFNTPPTLTVGAQAIWDPDAEECESFHGYPTKGYKKSKPVERDAIDVHWISDRRDPQRTLQFGARRGLVADVLEQIDVATPIATAIAEIQNACKSFAAVPDLDALLKSAGTQLGKLVPEVAANPYTVESTASTDLGVLRQLQLALEHAGPSLPIADQSSGLAQLTLFAFSLLIASKDTGAILLIDEPELSLHAHCQRALLRAVQELPNQFLIATHAAGLLDRADPRQVVRLHRDGTQIKDARASSLTAQEAAILKRYMTTQNAEAFFARKAILVEGLSDKYAIEALAARRGKNLDAAGVSIVDMSGAGGIKTYLTLLGPLGLRVILTGLCDVSDETKWSKALGSCGYPKAMDRVAMAKSGFFVCDTDLETVLIASLGTADVLKVIAARGDAAAFAAYAKQPAHSAKPLEGQLHDFLHADNIVYAPLLVDALDLAKVPASLEGIVNEI